MVPTYVSRNAATTASTDLPDHLMCSGHIISAQSLVDIAREYGLNIPSDVAALHVRSAVQAIKDGLYDEELACEHLFDTLFGEARRLRITMQDVESAMRELSGVSKSVLDSLIRHTSSDGKLAIPFNKRRK